jgi:hypothetical protein
VTAPTIRAELATAIKFLNREYAKLPESARSDIPRWGNWDDVLETALAADDHEAAVAAIHTWRDQHVAAFRVAAR